MCTCIMTICSPLTVPCSPLLFLFIFFLPSLSVAAPVKKMACTPATTIVGSSFRSDESGSHFCPWWNAEGQILSRCLHLLCVCDCSSYILSGWQSFSVFFFPICCPVMSPRPGRVSVNSSTYLSLRKQDVLFETEYWIVIWSQHLIISKSLH